MGTLIPKSLSSSSLGRKAYFSISSNLTTIGVLDGNALSIFNFSKLFGYKPLGIQIFLKVAQVANLSKIWFNPDPLFPIPSLNDDMLHW